jgi:hypothetical protein
VQARAKAEKAAKAKAKVVVVVEPGAAAAAKKKVCATHVHRCSVVLRPVALISVIRRGWLPLSAPRIIRVRIVAA